MAASVAGGATATTRPPCTPAPERVGAPVERQVAEPHPAEEAETREDLLECALGDRRVAGAETQRAHRAFGVGDGQARELRDPVAVQADGPRARVQPLAAAGLARPLGREGAEVAAVARLEALAEDGESPIVAVEDRAALAGAELGDRAVERYARR